MYNRRRTDVLYAAPRAAFRLAVFCILVLSFWLGLFRVAGLI